jgi:hypothetical protein
VVPIPVAACRDLELAWITLTNDNPTREFWLCYRFGVVQTDEKIYLNAQTGEVLRREQTTLECLPTWPIVTEPGVGVSVRTNTLFYEAKTITTLKKDTAYFLADPSKPLIGPIGKRRTTTCRGLNWIGVDNLASDINVMYVPDYPGAAFLPVDSRFRWGRISPAKVDEMADAPVGSRALLGATNTLSPWMCLPFTHGVVENSMGGLNRYGQPGALNEALADVMAAAVDRMGSDPWLMAKKVFTGTGIRNLATPKTSSTRTQPDTFGKFWIESASVCNRENDYCGIHVNSGVIVRWFYLICNGGMGTDDFDDKYSLKAGEQVTTEEAAQLIFQTIPLLNPASEFEHFSNLSAEVAKNLFGKCTKKARAVEYAWYAVGSVKIRPSAVVTGLLTW